MRKILVATTNEGKIKEIKDILTEFEIISLKDINYEKEIQEDGKTFEENALKKVKTINKHTKMPCIGDDSGICIYEYNRMARSRNSKVFRTRQNKK